MLSRNLKLTLLRQANHFPVLAITGPRQSGKTLLARASFPEKRYVNLEDPSELEFASSDPKGFLKQFNQPEGAIFDEAQRWPELFSYLQVIVDQDRSPGRFILTGSQQFGLRSSINQSLAGRIGMNTLLPIAFDEREPKDQRDITADEAMLRGSYPQMVTTSVDTNDWMSSYFETYVQRDIRQIHNLTDIATFTRFVRLCAARSGQLLNMSNIAVEAGVALNTVKAWLSVLETSYLICMLQPYHLNFGKRLVKTPKLYFLDTGLLCWLLGITTHEQLQIHPFRGAIFESWIVAEAMKNRFNSGRHPNLFFWRDNHGLEADLMFETVQGIQAVEIKSAQTITQEIVKAGLRSASMISENKLTPWVVHAADDHYMRSNLDVVSWRKFAERFGQC